MLPPAIPSEHPAPVAPAAEPRPDACDGCGAAMPGGAEVFAFERGAIQRFCSFRCQEGGPRAVPCAPPPPPVSTRDWAPELVTEALVELRVRCDGDRAETAARLRLHHSRRWSFDSTHQERAIRALAAALEAGDDVAATEAARWIAAPVDAMALALAALNATAKGGA